MLEKKNKRFLALLAIVAAVVVVVIVIVVNVPRQGTLTDTDPVEYANDTIKYTYYDPGTDTQKTETVQAGEEDTLRTLADAVSQSYFGQPLDQSPMSPNSIRVDGSSLYYDFKDSISQTNLGAASEVALLDSLAQAYKSNLDSVTDVYFSVNGGDFVTGSMDWPKDVPYENEYGTVETTENV
mgnify:CR=1 FL=1